MRAAVHRPTLRSALRTCQCWVMEIAVDSFFIVFVHQLDELGPPIAYRGDGGNVVVYDTRPEAEDAAVVLTATNKNSSFSFTVTEFQPS